MHNASRRVQPLNLSVPKLVTAAGIFFFIKMILLLQDFFLPFFDFQDIPEREKKNSTLVLDLQPNTHTHTADSGGGSSKTTGAAVKLQVRKSKHCSLPHVSSCLSVPPWPPAIGSEGFLLGGLGGLLAEYRHNTAILSFKY